MNYPRSKWTDAENDYLRTHYIKRTSDELQSIADHLGRKFGGVEMQARRLGLYQRGRQPRWPDRDTEFLRQHWKVRSDKWIAKELGRDVGGVKSRRLKLGLHRRKLPPIIFTVHTAAGVVGIDEHAVLRWIKQGLLKAKKAKGRTVQWEIKPRHLREFLQTNPDKWNSQRAPRIIQEINSRELEKDLRKWAYEAENVKRKVPEDLSPAFARFVADVAMGASERIKEGRNPDWYRKKVEQDASIPVRHQRRWITAEDRQLREMYKQCLTYSQMAEKLGRNYAGVSHRMGAVNIWEV